MSSGHGSGERFSTHGGLRNLGWLTTWWGLRGGRGWCASTWSRLIGMGLNRVSLEDEGEKRKSGGDRGTGWKT